MYKMRIFKRVRLYILLIACVGIITMFNTEKGYCKTVKSTTGDKPDIKFDHGLEFSIPDDWKWIAMSDQGNQHERFVQLSHGRSGIVMVIYPTRDTHMFIEDSRRPRYYAQRFSSAWGVPLFKWSKPDGTHIYETYYARKRSRVYVLSAVSSRAEVQSVAILYDYMSIAQAREVIRLVLKTSRWAGQREHLFNVSAKAVPVRVITQQHSSKPDSRIMVQIGHSKITLTKDWFPEDLVPPSGLGDADDPFKILSLYLLSHDTDELEGTLRIYWWSANEDGVEFLKRREWIKKQLSRHSKSEFNIRHLDVHGLPAITICKLVNKYKNIRYICDSPRLVFIADGHSSEKSCTPMLDKEVDNLLIQIFGSSVGQGLARHE